jgi:hypothetical protein
MPLARPPPRGRLEQHGRRPFRGAVQRLLLIFKSPKTQVGRFVGSSWTLARRYLISWPCGWHGWVCQAQNGGSQTPDDTEWSTGTGLRPPISIPTRPLTCNRVRLYNGVNGAVGGDSCTPAGRTRRGESLPEWRRRPNSNRTFPAPRPLAAVRPYGGDCRPGDQAAAAVAGQSSGHPTRGLSGDGTPLDHRRCCHLATPTRRRPAVQMVTPSPN